MRYSLTSRFRATFLGASLQQVQSVNCVNSASSRHEQVRVNEYTSWERVATGLTYSLIQSGRFDRTDRAFVDLIVPEMTRPTNAKAIVATLPLALFYHDHQTKLRQNLQQFALWFDDPEIAAGSLAVGYAIAASLKEQLRATTILPQIITFIAEPHLQLTHQLAQVQNLLEHNASLAEAISVLEKQPSSAIALAFYCFLSTPHDLQLSVMRAAITSKSRTVGAIVGALSGAYNGTASIPIRWRLALSHADRPLAAWGCQDQAEMLSLCDSLFAVWSGVYHSTTLTSLVPATAIAAPRVIRPR